MEPKEQLNPNDPFNSLVILDNDTKEFTSNDGREFFKHSDIETFPIARYEMWERLSIELGFATSFKSVYDVFTHIEELTLQGERSLVIVECHNTKRGMSRITNDRHTIALYMCSLFIYEKGEDPFTWSIEKADSKIACWQKEFAVGFFLTSAISLVNGYKERFLSTTEEFSKLSQMSQFLSSQEMDEREPMEME